MYRERDRMRERVKARKREKEREREKERKKERMREREKEREKREIEMRKEREEEREQGHWTRSRCPRHACGARSTRCPVKHVSHHLQLDGDVVTSASAARLGGLLS